MSEPTRILVVEDQPSDAELNQHEVERVLPGSLFRCVETPEDFVAALGSFQPDVILSDYKLPFFDGMAALKLAREHAPDTPFIVVTGTRNEDTAVACMKAGAWDYVIKEHIKRLGSAVISTLEQRQIRQERKLTEAALRESEEKYRALFHHAGDAIFIHDLAGRILAVNPLASERLGYTHAELMSMTISQLDAPAEVPLVPARIDNVLKHGHLAFETVHRREDGGFIPTEVHARRITWEKKPAIMSICRDISARKRMEEALDKRLVALTRPLDQEGDVSFADLFDADQIQRIQDEFAAATGVASVITHPDGTPITRPSNFCRLCAGIIRQTEAGRCNCYHSDAILGDYHPSGPIIQPCLSGGLWDAGASITVGDRHIANWLIGQVRDETQSEEKMRAYARSIGANETAFMEAFREVPAMPLERFKQVAQALFTLANQLSTTAYQNLQQARFISERRHAEKALKMRNDELERFNRVTIGRELRMIELKREINKLLAQAGLPPRYPLNFDNPPASEIKKGEAP